MHFKKIKYLVDRVDMEDEHAHAAFVALDAALAHAKHVSKGNKSVAYTVSEICPSHLKPVANFCNGRQF